MQNNTAARSARVTKERDVRIHAELWHTANCLLEVGLKVEAGSAHQFRASLIFRAFALEAFLNWVGYQLLPHWNYLERLKPREKLDLIAEMIHITPDYGSRPWQLVKGLLDFRNNMAHGKPENLTSVTFEPIDGRLDAKLGEHLKADWEHFGTKDNAVKAREAVEEIAEMLYTAAKLETKSKGPYGPFSFGFQLHGAALGEES